MNKDPFKEYIKESEPTKRYKGYAWNTAIGLQAVDGLKISDYLMHTAIRNIEGEISFDEANDLLQSYYEENPVRKEPRKPDIAGENRTLRLQNRTLKHRNRTLRRRNQASSIHFCRKPQTIS